MNMRDIAKLAGVSSATVSHVINGSNVVSSKTADKVRKVLKETRFVPNGSAALLKYGRSNTYGLIIPDITNPFFPEFVRSFENLLVEKDQEMLMATTDLHASELQQTIRRMLTRQVDGVALLAAEIESEPIEALIHHRVPLVTMERRVISCGISDVAVDYLSGIRGAVWLLKSLGHQRIAYIGGTAGLTISAHRVDAFMQAMGESELKLESDYVQAGDYRISGGEAGMERLIALKRPPTAIMATNDLTAVGALRAIRRCGYAVPQDFSIVGFDDIELSDMIDPPLTTIRLPRKELAATFYEALSSFENNPDAPGKQYMVASSLVVRSSIGAPRKKLSLMR